MGRTRTNPNAPQAVDRSRAPSIATALLVGLCASASLGAQTDASTVNVTDALATCRGVSTEPDAVHACLDERLGELDARMERLGREALARLDTAASEGFRLSQRAFAAFRRENCLWYLEIARPPREADQVAKNCLVDLTLQRLAELERLLGEDRTPTAIVVSGSAPDTDEASAPTPVALNERASGAADSIDASEEPALRAYFGDWRADCVGRDVQARCQLGVAVTDTAPALVATAASADGNRLVLERGVDRVVAIEIDLPGIAVDSANDLRWQVDGRDLVTLRGGRLIDTDDGVRHRIDDADTIAALLPSLRDGVELVVDVTGAGIEGRGASVAATLMGLTRALAFADDFADGGVLE